MDSFFQTSSYWLQIVAALVTVVSAFVAFLREKYENIKQPEVSTKYPLGHTEVFPSLKWIVLITLVVYLIVTCVPLFLPEISNTYLYCTIATSILIALSLGALSTIGKKSLESRSVIAPKKLWQVLFNRIPSYLEECDGPFRIYILKIGIEEDGPQNESIDNLLSMEINKQIKHKIEQIRKSKEGQTFRENDKGLYDIIENDDPFYHRTDKDNIHGIIVFVGHAVGTEKVDSQIHALADKFPNASIGYYSFGAYPADKYPPYINLVYLRTEDYIDHLIFRYYARSKEWQKLSKVYRNRFWALICVVAILLAAIIGSRIMTNYRTEHSKIVLSAPESSQKSTFTKLVNSLLVSPKPSDVKIWVKSKTSDSVINTHRYSEQGYTSKPQNDSSIIATVIKARVFLLYDVSLDPPYMVWTSDGNECKGCYYPNEDAYACVIDGKHYVFKWVPSKKNRKTYDDRRIRVMYSYDDTNAVEIVYAQRDDIVIREAARHSEAFLLPIQQFLILATTEGLKLDN